MFKKAFILGCIYCGMNTAGYAQLVNNGQVISVSPGGMLYVSGDYKHTGGSVTNQGVIRVDGDWTNNSTSSVFAKNSKGSILFSGSDQIIGGTEKTIFPDMVLAGNGTKTLAQNTDTYGSLKLNDRELRINQHTFTVLSTSPDAITRTTGYVSTNMKGVLKRRTAQMGSYLFPFGSSVLYRPVVVEPLAVGADSFSGTFNVTDPTISGYDRTTKRKDLSSIFDKYYYTLSHDDGTTPTDVKFYLNTNEGDYKQLVNWGSSHVWEKAAPSFSTDAVLGDGLNRFLLYKSLQSFKETPFSFANTESEFNPLTIFNAFSPDGDGKNDTWLIKNIDFFPNNELKIFNRWGSEVYKSKSYSSINAWDGGNLQSGTYFYVLNVEIGGEKKSYKGFITMIKKD